MLLYIIAYIILGFTAFGETEAYTEIRDGVSATKYDTAWWGGGFDLSTSPIVLFTLIIVVATFFLASVYSKKKMQKRGGENKFPPFSIVKELVLSVSVAIPTLLLVFIPAIAGPWFGVVPSFFCGGFVFFGFYIAVALVLDKLLD